MHSETADFLPLKLSTGELPARDRLPYWRESVGRMLVHVDIEPLSDGPFQAEATLLAWPGLRAIWVDNSTPAYWNRTSEMLADGDDSLGLILGQGMTMWQGANEMTLTGADAVGVLNAEPAKGMFPQSAVTGLSVPRALLAPFVRDIEGSAMRLIPRDNEALRLLVKYCSILREEPDRMTHELRHLAVTHIQDLIAMALGATRDGAAIASGRGLRAARLRSIKADITDNLANATLSVDAVALRQGVSPRYIQMLFEEEGTTFSQCVIGQRLVRAHRMLTDPRFAGRSITSIAFEAGFGDLSYFNRAFRRCYGGTPSEVRADADRRRRPVKD